VGNCYAATSGGKTVVVYTNWSANTNWVHVKVCWSTPTFFAKVVGVDSLSPCGSATAQSTVIAPVNTSGCAANDLSSTVGNPITPGSTTLTATYNGTLPIDPNHIIFIGTDSSGNLVKVNQGPGGYTLTYGSGTTATLSYTPPAGMTTTASLFVTDTKGKSCGQLAWSSCPVSTHDNFIETNSNGLGIADHGMGTVANRNPDGDADDTYGAAQLANSALIADADDSVTPGPGQGVGPGATLSATYHDETDIRPDQKRSLPERSAGSGNFPATARQHHQFPEHLDLQHVLQVAGYHSQWMEFGVLVLLGRGREPDRRRLRTHPVAVLLHRRHVGGQSRAMTA
jgi:hypothetical protein